MPVPASILVLGGVAEAYDLAHRLDGRPGVRVISSLAGRTDNPRLPAGETRLGGFGGVEGLADYLRQNRIGAVIDGTHPFAARMGWNAAAACAVTHTPLLRLERPAWTRQHGDLWLEVDDWDQAVAWVDAHAQRVLLAVGRQELAPFVPLRHVWFLIRSVQGPDPRPDFAQSQMMLARGPFSLEDELDLLTRLRIDTIICKNSGGPTDSKLTAARHLGIPVVIRNRPARPLTPRVDNVAQALSWLENQP